MVRNTKQTDYGTQFMEFMQKYWMVIGGLIFVYPLLKRYLAKQKELAIEQNNNLVVDQQKSNATYVKEIRYINNMDPKKQLTERQKITGSKELWAASTNLANDFGVIYSDDSNWYDIFNVRGWTENDREIRNTLSKYRNYFGILEKLYFQVDTNSRNLRKDILKYLDPQELKEIRKFIKI
ncbi:hypothetical protein [Flavobacterium laiguense]|uniref:Uncharacterized protein n=1 Tax=Flavobacterium laiguense TaxID=2169409 RepID=A0A2U1JVX1_9FLAO|nr:hypothetical protein [Flavobacterium laiguense]PWA08973.1 hypothetical protein DB891_09995 [Flavobacterium laiguense]